MQLTRDGVRFFGIYFYWYGILLVAAAWAGIEAASRLAKRDGRRAEHVWRAMLWVIPLAILGARLWFVIFPPQSVVANGRTADWLLGNFFDVNQGGIAVWTGGLGIIGAVMGGLLGAFIYARRNHEPLLPWLDVGALGLVLAQAVGRWANGINQELYGPPTSLPWGILIDKVEQRVAPYTDLSRYPIATTAFHPVWLYESLLCFIIFAVLLIFFWRRAGKPRRFGEMALLYLLLYGGGRFFLEFLRVNVSLVAGINISQTVMLLAALGSGIVLWRGRAKPQG